MRLDSVVILDSARTAIGSFGGSLAGLAPHELGTITAREALARAGIEAGAIDHAVYGHIITTGPQDAYLARHIALDAGVPEGAAAFNVNRLCGSGVQAILSAAQQIVLGDSRLALAGGAESMSRGAYLLPPQARNGLRMGHASVTDLTLGVLSDPFGSGHMGVTAENIAKRCGLERQEIDRFALESHHKAARAIAEGRFESQIVPVTVREGKTSASSCTTSTCATVSRWRISPDSSPPSPRRAWSPPATPRASTTAPPAWCWPTPTRPNAAVLRHARGWSVPAPPGSNPA